MWSTTCQLFQSTTVVVLLDVLVWLLTLKVSLYSTDGKIVESVWLCLGDYQRTYLKAIYFSRYKFYLFCGPK